MGNPILSLEGGYLVSAEEAAQASDAMLDVSYHFLPEGREGGAQGETADPLGDTLRILHEQITEEI